jgi:transposase
MDTVHTAITEPVRRLEVFTGAGRRRKWSDEDKARIVAEIVASGDSVCSVARRHGLSPQQLFGWRRQLREAAVDCSEEQEVEFVPAVVDAVVPAPALGRERKAVRRKAEADARARRCDAGIIEIEVDGITIRAGHGADTAMVAAIVHALKASR